MNRKERLQLYNIEKEKVTKLWNNPIPGLNIDKSEKEKIRTVFQKWAVHFQCFILEKGIDGLIKRYKNVVVNVKTQSCPHTNNGSLNKGEAYFACCGISYEYFNDISVREALQVIIASVKKNIQNDIVKKIINTDNDLKDLIMKNEENINPSFKNENSWWMKYLPYGVRK